jgi:hypothetical protein
VRRRGPSSRPVLIRREFESAWSRWCRRQRWSRWALRTKSPAPKKRCRRRIFGVLILQLRPEIKIFITRNPSKIIINQLFPPRFHGSQASEIRRVLVSYDLQAMMLPETHGSMVLSCVCNAQNQSKWYKMTNLHESHVHLYIFLPGPAMFAWSCSFL